jgi:hypothetical protein
MQPTGDAIPALATQHAAGVRAASPAWVRAERLERVATGSFVAGALAVLDRSRALTAAEPEPSFEVVRLDQLRALYEASGPPPEPRRDSLADQLRTVYLLAVSRGCNDAAEWIRDAIGRGL